MQETYILAPRHIPNIYCVDADDEKSGRGEWPIQAGRTVYNTRSTPPG